jgi:hypothetical protein
MQCEPTAIRRPPSGLVSGLGVCDALRLELAPLQVSWLAVELDATRARLEERIHEMGRDQRGELDRLGYELRLLRLMRGQLPAELPNEPVTFVGPTGSVCRIANAVLENAVAALHAHVSEGPPRSDDARSWLREIVTVVDGWAGIVSDSYAVEAYRFDPWADPAGAS